MSGPPSVRKRRWLLSADDSAQLSADEAKLSAHSSSSTVVSWVANRTPQARAKADAEAKAEAKGREAGAAAAASAAAAADEAEPAAAFGAQPLSVEEAVSAATFGSMTALEGFESVPRLSKEKGKGQVQNFDRRVDAYFANASLMGANGNVVPKGSVTPDTFIDLAWRGHAAEAYDVAAVASGDGQGLFDALPADEQNRVVDAFRTSASHDTQQSVVWAAANAAAAEVIVFVTVHAMLQPAAQSRAEGGGLSDTRRLSTLSANTLRSNAETALFAAVLRRFRLPVNTKSISDLVRGDIRVVAAYARAAAGGQAERHHVHGAALVALRH